MSKKSQTNLVGRTVLIDWPVRWRGAMPEYQEKLKAELASKAGQLEHRAWHYGETGEIVNVFPPDDSGNSITVLLTSGESKGELADLYQGAVTITSEAPNPEKEIVSLLSDILQAVKELHPEHHS